MSIKNILIMMVVYIQQIASQQAMQTNQCQNSTANTTRVISPILISNTTHSCSYNEIMSIQFANIITTAQSGYNQGILRFFGFPSTGFTLYAEDAAKEKQHYQLSYIQIVTPAQHKIMTSQINSATTMEMQIFFDQLYTGNLSLNANAPQAAISILFTNGTSEYYIPDGTHLLSPLFSYGNFDPATNQSTVDLNLNTMTSDLVNFYHQYFAYTGSNINQFCNKNVNWFVNTQVFLVNNQLLQRYNTLTNNNQIVGFTKNDGLLSGYSIYNDTNVNVLMICYSGLEETVLRQDYALWLWVLGIFVWWIVEVITENDTKECFMDEYNNNKWTQLPLYSIYWVNSDIFFTKLSRFVLILVIFSWEVTIMSILYAQFYNYGVYQLTDGYIIWYPIVALMLGWPMGYFFGSILYNINETWKEKTFLQIEWKKIIDKSSLEAVDINKGIEIEENRLYTSWFFFYLSLFFLMILDFGVSIWQNTFLTRQVQNYWVASIFLLVFMDMVIFDMFVAFMPGLGPRITKYRGFFYDFDLGQSYKRLEETS